jgi:hypothetical protein
MGNLLTALQQTIQEMPRKSVLDARIRPFANSVIQAWQIMEPEASKLNKA